MLKEKELSMYDSGVMMLKDSHTRHMGMMYIFTSISGPAIRLDCEKYKWLKLAILGSKSFKGIAFEVNELYLDWPVKPGRGFHRSNISIYNDKIKSCSLRLYFIITKLGGVLSIVEDSVEDYEWGTFIEDGIEAVSECFEDIIGVVFEEDVSDQLSALFKFKRSNS